MAPMCHNRPKDGFPRRIAFEANSIQILAIRFLVDRSSNAVRPMKRGFIGQAFDSIGL
jgi:hypothetical protein